MKKRLFVVLAGVLSVAGVCRAQTATGETLMLNLPRAAQHAVVTQRIGITDITVNYNRPMANGRQVWGKLVPYGQVWPAGANENTRIRFTDPEPLEGKPLTKGINGMPMIPAEKKW